MRVAYQEGKLILSLTKDEVDHVYENKGASVEIPIGNLKMLHEDISKAVLQHWENIQVPNQVRDLKRCMKK